MKKMLTMLIALLMAAMLSCALAEENPTVCTSWDYQYALLEDGMAEITKYTGDASELTVPATLGGHRVASIGDRAFPSSNL